MEHKNRSDFISVTVMVLFSTIVLLASAQIYLQADKPLHESPALLPLLTSAALLFVSILLFLRSFRDGGIRQRLSEASAWLRGLSESASTWRTVSGIGLMGIYVYVLVPLLPFWAASLIFMLALMFLLKAGRWWMMLSVSLGLVAVIYLIFSFVFRAPLP